MEEEVIIPISGETEEPFKKRRKKLWFLVGIFAVLFLAFLGLYFYQVRFVKETTTTQATPEPSAGVEASPSASPKPLTLTERLDQTEKEIEELGFEEKELVFPMVDLKIRF